MSDDNDVDDDLDDDVDDDSDDDDDVMIVPISDMLVHLIMMTINISTYSEFTLCQQ